MAIHIGRFPLVGLCVAAACDGGGLPEDEAFGVVDPGDFPDASIAELKPSVGYFDGLRVELYNTGEVTVDINPDGEPAGARANAMYWFYRESDETPLFELEIDLDRPNAYRLSEESQAPIVDTLPGEAEYTPYFEIVVVEVPDDYDANQIKSLKSLEEAADAGSVSLHYSGEAINCPIVDTEVELSSGASNRSRAIPRVALWYRRLRTYCYLFEQPSSLLCREGQPCQTAGFQMPDARVLVGTDATMGLDDEALSRPVLSIPLMDVYYPRTHFEFMSGKELDVVPADSAVFAFLPGDAAYSPLSRSLFVDIPFVFEAVFRSVEDFDPALAVPVDGADEQFFNIPVRGTVSPCTFDEDCDDGLFPPLTCNTESNFCDLPPRGFAEPCGPGVARCDHAKTADFPIGLACTGLRVQTTRYCYMRCDLDTEDTDPADDRDSRCRSIPDTSCVRTLRVVESDAGVCMGECNALAGAPESHTANIACERTPEDDTWDESHDAAIYDGSETAPFDMDDLPVEGASTQYNPDTAEPDGRDDLFEGQTCVTSIRDLCAWPDSRVAEYEEQVSE